MSLHQHNVFASCKFITADQVRTKCSNYVQQVVLQRQVFSKFARRQAMMGPRVVIPGSINPDEEANFSYIARSNAVGGRTVVKIGSVVPANSLLRPNPLPAVNAYIAVLSAKTGVLEAMIDGDVVTEIRTAAATINAIREMLLLKQHRNRRSTMNNNNNNTTIKFAVVGSGVQGLSHARMILANFGNNNNNNNNSLKGVRCSTLVILSNNIAEVVPSSQFKSLVAFASSVGVSVEHSSDILSGCANADVVVLCTNSAKSLFPADESRFRFKKGSVVVSIGSFAANRAEIDPSIVEKQFARVFVDDVETCVKQCGIVVGLSDARKKSLIGIGDLINFNDLETKNTTLTARDDSSADFVNIRKSLENESNNNVEDCILYCSVGLGIQDAAVAEFILDDEENTKKKQHKEKNISKL